MPEGKPAGVRCVHLTPERLCGLFGDPRRPAVCSAFQADADVCGDNRRVALANLEQLEVLSRPD
jgi:hypothetical protein|tara:strand:- start:31363 stop:31554 length:192 start_codon:yes stop_codon:yes gene_type:complete